MYRIDFNDFFTSAFSVDCILFGYSEGEIKALLIKRAMQPFENLWAIPGDLIYPDEDLEQAAERVLFELTGLNNIAMHQSQTFGKPNRHPQGRVITISYFALLRIEDFEVKASSWAGDVQWVSLKNKEPFNSLYSLSNVPPVTSILMLFCMDIIFDENYLQ